MQYVFVIDQNKNRLDPCHPARARKMLVAGHAAVFRRFPFTIILKDRVAEESVIHAHRVKLDPGSKTTGVALVRVDDNKVLWAGEIEHRGQMIVDALASRRAIRHNRRARHTRYRPARFDNRRRGKGWLPPSLESQLSNIQTCVNRLACYAPVFYLSMELVKFDTQVMENPEISGVEYQQGTLCGYEVREYLLEKWCRKCAYCGAKDKPLEIEHINPRSRFLDNRVSNLTLACHDCNQKKGNRTAAEFGHPEIQKLAKLPLKDAAAVNATRWELWRRLSAYGVPVECGSGGRTKYNRTRQGFPKTHWLDAACVGESGSRIFVPAGLDALHIKATGHGSRQMCRMDKYGFPRTSAKTTKPVFGFRTGDMVEAVISAGKYAGKVIIGKVAVRASGSFNITTSSGTVQGISYKYCQTLSLRDGYSYQQKGIALPPHA